MQLIDGRPVYAATDLVGFLACDHRLELERAALAGLVDEADPERPLDRPRRQARHRARARGTSRTCASRGGASSRSTRTGRPSRRSTRIGEPRAARRRCRAASRGRGDDRRDARRRGRRVPGDVLRRDLARPRGLPAAAQPRRRRARLRARAVALRGRRHQARPPRQGVGDPPDLLVRRAADGRSRASSRSTSTSSSAAASGRRTTLRVDGLHGLLPARQGRVRGRRRHPRGRRQPVAYPPVGDVPRAGRALRRLPLGRACARRSGAPTTTSAWSRAPAAAPAARAQGAWHRRRDAGSPVLDAADGRRALEGVGAAALERIREQARIQVESRGRGTRSCGSSCRSIATRTATPSPTAACSSCPSRARATCSSTSRATPSRSTTASTTCSASSSPRLRKTAGGPPPASDRSRSSTRSGASTTTATSPGRPRRPRSSARST